MSIKMSSSRTAPLEAPLPLTDLCREVVLLEMVRNSDEALAISTKCRLLDLVLIDMLLANQCPSPHDRTGFVEPK